MHLAVQTNFLEIINDLLLFDCDINAKKFDGKFFIKKGSTILHECIKCSSSDTLKYILNLNSNIYDQKKKLKLNPKDKSGNTPLFLCKKYF
jgi:hypothetical protein